MLVERKGEEKPQRAAHGLTRTLITNMVEGVTKGFRKSLEIQGVGYRAAKAGENLNLSLGYSHPVVFEAPSGITFTVEGTTKFTSTASTSNKSVKSLRRFASCVRPSRTRAKAFATRVKSFVRNSVKPGRQVRSNAAHFTG